MKKINMAKIWNLKWEYYGSPVSNFSRFSPTNKFLMRECGAYERIEWEHQD